MKKYCLIIIVFLALNNISNAQKLPLNNQYLVNRFSISPSYAGYKGITEGFLGYRKQWVDIQGAPITMMFDINSALGEKVGFGGRIISDKEGIFERLHVSANYAYHLTVASEHIISFGLAGKVFQTNLDLSKIIVEDDDDPVHITGPEACRTHIPSGRASFGTTSANH